MNIVSDNEGVTPEEVYSCEKCNFFTPHNGNYNKHLKSNKHRGIEKEQKKYSCVDCNYHTTYKTDYTRHMAGERHLRIIELLKNNLNKNQCPNCKKQYDSSSAFCKHKRTCLKKSKHEDTHSDDSDSESEDDKSTTPTPSPTTNTFSSEIVMELIQQNRDLQKIILEQNKNQNMTNSHNHSHNNTNINNNNNQTFNLQFFLNEHCKDAIDIQEFVNKLNYSTENLEKNMKFGYTKGISNMFLDGIRDLPVEKRPLHCSDEKREKLHIRDNGTWISGNDSKERLAKAIQYIAIKNKDTFRNWLSENPEFQTLDTPAYQKFITIYQSVIGSCSDEEEVKDVKKILSNIMDQIVIDKDKFLQ